MKIKLFAITTLCTLAALPAMALSVAVLDAQTVVTGTNAYKAAVSSLSAKRDAAQKKLKAMEAPLAEKEKTLIEQASVMDKAKLQAAQEELKKDVIGFRTEARNIQEALDKENFETRKKIAEAVQSAVDSIAKEKGYDIVMPKAQTLFVSDKVVDITKETLAKTNAILK
ncbi:MAG: hypothetical protein COY40_05410 [Alphaproteobacteria bacterium CG_4_10_14_0_8_um_filter_53_9]|nr:MAG: hypothetical protein COY40_05410 [Alphaproteobacteria bacterium CG_4_10_14_0_8_um_filter_53_9]